jgi:hypothetical protein
MRLKGSGNDGGEERRLNDKYEGAEQPQADTYGKPAPHARQLPEKRLWHGSPLPSIYWLPLFSVTGVHEGYNTHP